MCLPLSSTRGGGAGGATSGISTPVYATAYHNSKTKNGAHVQVLSATSPPSSRLLESNQIVETGSERSHQVRGTAGHSLTSHIARPYARILESSSQCRKSRSKKCDMPPDTTALLVYSCVCPFSPNASPICSTSVWYWSIACIATIIVAKSRVHQD